MIDLQELERKIDALLESETEESLREWLSKQTIKPSSHETKEAEKEGNCDVLCGMVYCKEFGCMNGDGKAEQPKVI